MKIFKLKTIFVVLLFVLPLTILAQVSVSGVVSDERGDTLPGVNVIVKGTTRGTATDYDGKFTVQVSPGEVIEFWFRGLEKEELIVGIKPNLQVIYGN